ncbi:hypothetical protein AUJ59_01180 [Candidatus Beckwithbacteria bacterium CG1_02_47_37]|nr:MAG: hypothetical protein AUJ59_01180 [Candidatus Beckwithbacteria bacterium CG1_02_47_37]
MKALITGANGFTGKHLCQFLRSKKIAVFKFQGDLKDKSAVLAAVARIKPDWIFHLASPILRSDQLLDQALADNLKVDLFGTVYLIEAAAALPKKPKILITGTAAEYQNSSLPISEMNNLQPVTSYGLSKLTQELVSHQLCQSYNLPLIFTRTFLLIGPGQKPGFVVNDLCRAAAEGKTQITVGNPKIRRDFTDVRDAAQAYYLLMKQGKPGEVYNVCSGKTVSIGEIADRLKLKIKIRKAWRQNDPPVVCGDNRKIKQLGWQPQISLDQSLKDTLGYWKKHDRH